MEDHLNDFSKLHLKALKEDTYYTLIKDDVNYEDYFRKGFSLEQVFKIFNDGITFPNGYIIKLPFVDIVGFYFLYDHSNTAEIDTKFLYLALDTTESSKLTSFIVSAKEKVSQMKAYSLRIGALIQMYLMEIETYKPIEYDILENNEEKTYKLFIKGKDGDIEREVNQQDALDIFNKIEPSMRYPVILFSNSKRKIVGSFSNHFSVDFDTYHIQKISLPPNSLALLNRVGEYVLFDFDEKKCLITTNPDKINDDKAIKIMNFMNMLYFQEEETNKKIVGKINFNIDKVIGYYSLYEFFILDKIASILFYIDETKRAWCSKEPFYVFFRDFSYEMIGGKESKTSDNYFRLSIPTQRKESISGFSISFATKSKDMLNNFLYKFSRIFGYFISQNNPDDSFKEPVKVSRAKIYTKTIQVLNDKAREFFKPESKDRNETGGDKSGYFYSRRCQGKDQPIIIEPEEIPSWQKYGRTPVLFPPLEWGFKKAFWFVCPKDSDPVVNMQTNYQDKTGRIKFLPCCLESEKVKDNDELVVKGSNRRGITEFINSLGSIGALNNTLSTFLSISFYKDGTYTFLRQGSTIEDNEMSYLNSAIISVLIATEKSVIPNRVLSLLTIKDIQDNITAVRELMAKLPPDIYKQELYDMSDKDIIESILDPKTFIDPYLYYRGLEVIFDIQLFVFTSNIGRKNPISDEEDNLPISSLELPRFKHTHIRNNTGKDIICLYKNYGTINKTTDIPPCELLICTEKDTKNFAKKVNSSNKSFFDSLFNLLDKSCHPYEWEKTTGIHIGDSCYDNPYNTINWSSYDFGNLGEIKGQEIDICGKTNMLLFDEWTLVIPLSQPLIIFDRKLDESGYYTYKTKTIKIKDIGNQSQNEVVKYKNHEYFSGGKKNRAAYKSVKEACEFFDFTAIDEDGIWIEFNGKKKGIKVLCHPKISRISNTFNSTIDLINRKNNVSILMQIINWLWRSDWNGFEFPNFSQWWSSHTVIEESVIFHQVPNPKRNCNNMMLPNLNNFDERLSAMTKIWPFFFYRNKIHVSPELFERIKNNFNIEDIYSRGMTPNDLYDEPGRFITDLIVTDDDFKSNNSIILSNPEHIFSWVNRNSSAISKYRSLSNAEVIRERIPSRMKKMLKFYIYKEVYGDNAGQIYIIQNSSIPKQPPELSALKIAQYWRTHEKNPGHDYQRDDDSIFISSLKYVLYKIDANDTPQVFLDKSEGSEDYLQVLCYDDNETYAAMLPLLKKSSSSFVRKDSGALDKI